jgi:hypothetical protein
VTHKVSKTPQSNTLQRDKDKQAYVPQGYSSVVAAYGAPGSGKSYTLEVCSTSCGDIWSCPCVPSSTFRTVSTKLPSAKESTLKLCFLHGNAPRASLQGPCTAEGDDASETGLIPQAVALMSTKLAAVPRHRYQLAVSYCGWCGLEGTVACFIAITSHGCIPK